VINQVQPIAVTFSVPQGEFQRLGAVSDGFRQSLTVQAISQETGAVLDTGQLRVVDNRVDQATGTVELKASFSNAIRNLWPGQFVNVRLDMQRLPNATVIPLTAVNRGPRGQYVFLVGPDHKVSMRQVELVTTQGQVAVVKSGVKPGDVVVTDGQMTLNQGSLVKVARLGPVGSPTP
jgi:multidrug efflux system membrane fusion protein